MKNMKKIVAAILSLSMVGAVATTSFAAALNWENDIEFSAKVSPTTAKAGDDVTVSFYVKDATNGDAIELASGGTYYLQFSIDEAVVTYKSHAIGQDYGSETFASKDVSGDLFYTNMIEPSATATITTDAPIFTYVFTVNENVEAGAYDIITAMNDGYVGDAEGNEGSGTYTYDSSAAKVTVTKAAPAGATATADGAAVNGITAYTIANDAEIDGAAKKVITKTFDKTEITDATRVYVTIDGVKRVFGSDLVSAASGLTVGKLTFGIIVDKNVDLTTVTDFRFE